MTFQNHAVCMVLLFLLMSMQAPIGVFDSGFGGLTVLKEIVQKLPQYDYIYFGDNARAPYGTRSYESVYHYTLECVQWFFKQGCPLVVLACNTASAKALRSIQQNYLPLFAPRKKVLGVIRPTAEKIGGFTKTGNVGVLGTSGTVQSKSYVLEIENFFPNLNVFQEACPMWVPLIENNEHETEGADYFIHKHLLNLTSTCHNIDVMLLGCTHYPLIKEQIEKFLPPHVKVISQGKIVADSLAAYLDRHNDIQEQCSKNGQVVFYTTDSVNDFNVKGSMFYGEKVKAKHVELAK